MNLTGKDVDEDRCILCAISYSKRKISVKIFYANSSNVFAGFFSNFAINLQIKFIDFI